MLRNSLGNNDLGKVISKTSYQIADFVLEKQKITQNLLETLPLASSF